MKRISLETSIKINSSAAQIWQVFTDPTLTRQMGGEFISDWMVGSSIEFKSTSGQILTSGTITAIEPKKLLQYKLVHEGSTISTITYRLEEKGGVTTLIGREEFAKPVSQEIYNQFLEGWQGALEAVKAIVEK